MLVHIHFFVGRDRWASTNRGTQDRLIDPRRARQRAKVPLINDRIILHVFRRLAIAADGGVIPSHLTEIRIGSDANIVQIGGVEVLENDVPYRTCHHFNAVASHFKELTLTHPINGAIKRRRCFATYKAAARPNFVELINERRPDVLHRPQGQIGPHEALLRALDTANNARALWHSI